MWILPKQLHTSAFVLDTAALISDLAEQSQICEQSLLARSKPSLARTWSQKWKRDSWTQHLSGRILRPSFGQSFVTAWTSSLEVIPASHSQQQGSDSDETTLDTSGLGSQMEFVICDHESASLKTSKDTSASDSERSLANWKALVIKRRGEYSQRVKSAHLTNASECSSWPTAKARDWKDTMGCSLDAVNPDGTHRNRRDRLVGAIAAEIHGQAVPVSHSTDGNRQESWATPNTMDCLPSRSYEAMKRQATNGERKNRTKPGNLREQIDPLMCQAYKDAQAEANQWATPRAGKTTDENPESWQKRADAGQVATMPLTAQVKAWATPRTPTGGPESAQRKQELGRKTSGGGDLASQASGKLNPRWVETLMGLPVGWTMPSCKSPVTIAPTSCDYSETESCLQQQPELF